MEVFIGRRWWSNSRGIMVGIFHCKYMYEIFLNSTACEEDRNY